MNYIKYLKNSLNFFILKPTYIDGNELIFEDDNNFFTSNRKAILISKINKIIITKKYNQIKIEVFDRDFFERENKSILKNFDSLFFNSHINPIFEELKIIPEFGGSIFFNEIYDNIC